MRNNLIKLVLLTLLSLAGLSQHPAHVKKIELYVSPSGRDTNTGTEKKPFKTIGRALVAVRELKKKKQITADGIDIIFREGTYFLNEPLSFTSENSGSPNAPITYRAYEKEKVV